MSLRRRTMENWSPQIIQKYYLSQELSGLPPSLSLIFGPLGGEEVRMVVTKEGSSIFPATPLTPPPHFPPEKKVPQLSFIFNIQTLTTGCLIKLIPERAFWGHIFVVLIVWEFMQVTFVIILSVKEKIITFSLVCSLFSFLSARLILLDAKIWCFESLKHPRFLRKRS